MNLSVTLHLLAGLGALALGGGILLRDASRTRNRAFAWLCGALTVWNLGLVGHQLAPAETRPLWRSLFLLGSCAAAPLALRFTLVIAGARRGRRLLLPAFALSAALWISLFTPIYRRQDSWAVAAIVGLGGILAVALIVQARHVRQLPAGPERNANRLILWGAVIAVAGGISDFIPRHGSGIVRIGPLAILIFLLFVCAMIVRHRFLDVGTFLIRAVSLVAGGSAVGLIFYAVMHYVGTGYVVLFVTSVAVLAAAGPLGRLLLTRARYLVTPADPVAASLMEISRKLPLARSTPEIWSTIDEGRRALAEDIHLDIYLRRPEQERFHLVHRSGNFGGAEAAPVAADATLAKLLAHERLPLTLRYLEQERRESSGPREVLAARALEEMSALDLRVIAPLTSSERLAGWVGVGGGLADRYLTAEVATAFLAVGNQFVASLDRLEALETARRKQALAAVGELAAGLAHEIRNPLAAIRGAAQAMGPQSDGQQRADMLEVIADESARLGRVVGEFLDYAKPASPRREPVDLGALARRVLERQALSGDGFESELRVKEDAPPALGDPDQLQRAFENLVRNAREAAESDVRVRVEIYPGAPGRVAVRFEDNGPGIPAEEVPRLFRPFHTTKHRGTGLGLALIHRIVEAHEGEIHVEGRPGVGAVFTVSLPAAGGAAG